MRNHIVISLISIFFSVSSANACIESYSYLRYGIPPFVPDDTSSLESIENSLKSHQTLLQNALTKTNQQLQSVQQFLSAQKALKISWVTVENDKKISDPLYVPYDGNKAEICRAKFLTGTHPGVVSKSGCLITYGGYVVFMPKYDVLVGKINTQWKSVDASTLRDYQNIYGNSADNANSLKQNLVPIQVGFENNIPLYVCKANYNNSVKIGKVNQEICNIPDGDKEVTVREFEVLFGEKPAT